MITVGQCRDAIRTACKALGIWSPAAEDLLLGTAIQESGLRYTQQLGGGPALGYWQMEPATHDDIWKNYLAYRPAFSVACLKLLNSDNRLEQLQNNPVYAAAMARLKYRRSPLSMPAQGDIAGYAKLWKVVYNTAGGAGTEQQFIDNWRLHAMPDQAEGLDASAAPAASVTS